MQKQDQNLNEILREIKHKIELHNRAHAEARMRGEEFNILEILRKEYSELAHSAIIAHLLDPKESHALGVEPLNIFMDIIGNAQWDRSDIENAFVDTEVPIDSDSKDESGRMDIVIRSGDKIIIIENKIYAGDQPKQLRRYKTFAESHYPNHHILLYLTLDGHDATDMSTDGLSSGRDYFVISYKKDIMKWLDRSIGLAIRKPLVREVLFQYRKTLDGLVQNNGKDIEKRDIYNYILRNGRAFAPVFTDDNYVEDRKRIEEFFRNDFFQYGVYCLMNELNDYVKGKGMICDFGDVSTGGRYCGFSIRSEVWSKFINFQFTMPYWKGCYYGVYSNKQVEPGAKMPHFTDEPNDHYCYGNSYIKYKNWDVQGLITGEIKGAVIDAIERTLEVCIREPEKYPM